MTDIEDLIDFLAASPSPWHAVASSAADRLSTAGYTAVDLGVAVERGAGPRLRRSRRRVGGVESRRRPRMPARRCAWSVRTPTRPCLRIKPRPDTGGVGWKQLGVEVYGGALINSWLDRDLGIAGRVELADGTAHRRHRRRSDLPGTAVGDPSRPRRQRARCDPRQAAASHSRVGNRRTTSR